MITMNTCLRSIAALTIAVTLAACDQSSPVREERVKEVRTFSISRSINDSARNMPARLLAAQRVKLSFRVPGVLQQLEVKEGDEVVAGQILAVLDQSDYETAEYDKKAAFESARDDYERAKQLIVDEAISEIDYDEVKAHYRITKAEYEQAKVDMEYTVLRAPFNGQVSTRSVENFEEIIAGQEIFYLTDTSKMDVKFDVPESVMIAVRNVRDELDEDDVGVTLSLPDQPELRLPMEFKEVAQKADQQTQTYEVTYQVEQPEEFILLPGMTASAHLEFYNYISGEYKVPVRAVFGDIHMNPRVWILDESTMTVSSREVDIGHQVGRSVAIVGGVDPGEVLVASHVAFLREGEAVQYATSRDSE